MLRDSHTVSRLARRSTLASLGATMLVVGACRDVTPVKAGPGEIGGTLVVASPNDATSLLPGLVATSTDRLATDMLFDRLAEIGDDMNTIGDRTFRPQLAQRWEWAHDSLSIVFHLNPLARWHDGLPVRASDVRYSVALVRDPAFGSPAQTLTTNIDSVSVRDSVTAVAWFKRHTPEQFYDLVYQIAIVPEHILANTPVAQLKTADVARRGIGSGRFRLARWEPGARVELIADTANYRGRPKLDRVVVAVSPDFNGAVTRFFAGDADMLEIMPADYLKQIASDTARRALFYDSFGYTYLAFNLSDPRTPGQPHPVFGDRIVRRALSMAVDRRAMLRNVFDTLGRALYGPAPRTLPVADTTIPQLAYDTIRARALLDSAGWTRGPDGVRVKNGRRLSFAITTPNSSTPRMRYAVLLQDAFKRVGAEATIEKMDFASFLAKQSAKSFDTEMANFTADPSPSGLKQSWSTAGIGKDGFNYASYSNPGVDALLDSATSTFDPARTRAFARRAFETMVEDAPAIWLYEPLMIAGLHKRIHPTRMRTDGWWSGLAGWSIPAAQRSARDAIGLRAAP